LEPRHILVTGDGHISLKNTFRLEKSSELLQEESTHAFKKKNYCVAPETLKGEQFTEKSLCWHLGCVIYQMLTGSIPFYSPNIHTMFQETMKGILKIPESIPEDAKSLLTELLKTNPDTRIRLQDITSHSFFHDLDWTSVMEKKYQCASHIQLKKDLHIDTVEYHSTTLRREQPIDTFIAPEEVIRLEGFTFVGT